MFPWTRCTLCAYIPFLLPVSISMSPLYLKLLAYLSVFRSWFFVTDCMLLSASPLPRVPRLFQNVLAGLPGVTSLLWITISSPARICTTSRDCLFPPLDDICQKIFANPFNVYIFVWNSLNRKSLPKKNPFKTQLLLNLFDDWFILNPFSNQDILLPYLDTYL